MDTASCNRHFNNSILSTLTAKVFTKYLLDVTQFWIVHRLYPAWLVSLQDLSAGIAVPGLLGRDSSSVELAVHVFSDLEVRGCTFHKEAHQSYKHQPMNNTDYLSLFALEHSIILLPVYTHHSASFLIFLWLFSSYLMKLSMI